MIAGPDPATALSAALSSGFAGFILGMFQRKVLLERSPAFSSWHRVTGLGSLVGGFLAVVVLNSSFLLIANGIEVGTASPPEVQVRLVRVMAVALFLCYPLFGAALGWLQSLAIQRVSSKARLWVLANVLLFAIGFVAITLFPGFSLTGVDYDEEVLGSFLGLLALASIISASLMPFILTKNPEHD